MLNSGATILWQSRSGEIFVAWVANSIATIWFPILSTRSIRVGPRRAFIIFFHVGRRSLVLAFGARIARQYFSMNGLLL
jgi:hypothetical protein